MNDFGQTTMDKSGDVLLAERITRPGGKRKMISTEKVLSWKICMSRSRRSAGKSKLARRVVGSVSKGRR